MIFFIYKRLRNPGFNWATKPFAFAFALTQICTAETSDCNTSLTDVQATQFKSSVVVNGEVDREENGKRVEPFRSIAKPTQIGFIPGNS